MHTSHAMQEILTAQNAYERLKDNFHPHAEEVWLLCIDNHLRLLDITMLSRGTLDCCICHPRDLLRVLVSHNTYGFILAHSHPSRLLTPSESDLKMTNQIKKIAKLIEINFLDHLIFSDQDFYSFKNSGYKF